MSRRRLWVDTGPCQAEEVGITGRTTDIIDYRPSLHLYLPLCFRLSHKYGSGQAHPIDTMLYFGKN